MKTQHQYPLPQHQQQQHPAAAGEPRMGAASVVPPGSTDQWKKQSEVEAAEREELRKRRVDTCKRVTKDVVKKIVLYGAMALYTVLGGYAFVALEQTNEKEMCFANSDLYDQMEAQTAKSLWKISRSFLKTDDEDRQRDLIQGQMVAFRDNVLLLNFDGRNCSTLGTPNGTTYSWNLASGLLFSVTIFSTVGYGNITPQTTWGRLVCIAYAMFGIPLMFVCLASIGEILGEVFRFIYIKICCLGACQRRRGHRNPPRRRSLAATTPTDDPSRKPTAADDKESSKRALIQDDEEDEEGEADEMSIPITVTLLVIAGYVGLGTIMFANWEGWDALKAGYYCFITISTIGFGDVVPGFSPNDSSSGLKMIVAASYLLFGMSLMSMGFDLIQYEMKNRVPTHTAGSPSVTKDEPPSYPQVPSVAGNRGVTPVPGQPSAWSDSVRAFDAMPLEAKTAADGMKKRGLHVGTEFGTKGTGGTTPQPHRAKLDPRSEGKIA